MFLQVSVCPRRGASVAGGVHGRGRVVEGACMVGCMCGSGVMGMCGGGMVVGMRGGEHV